MLDFDFLFIAYTRLFFNFTDKIDQSEVDKEVKLEKSVKIGIIDILQSYDLKKQSEKYLKFI
jgi:hypothetical protein